ncbi:uncharacterized protein LOC144714593 [Wolffia australiana]
MSLVAYDASSSDEDDQEDVLPAARSRSSEEFGQSSPSISGPEKSPSSAGLVQSETAKPSRLEVPNGGPIASTHVQSRTASLASSTSIKLPDAELLFSSTSFSNNQTGSSNHSSRVAAAMAENALRKRASNGSLPQDMTNKQKKRASPSSTNVNGRELIPPQLRGRSNVVTEDIGKLFVKKHP